jgi:acetyl-CoA synthetase
MDVPRQITKLLRAGEPPPNLTDSMEARRRFSWAVAHAELDGLPGGRGLNRAHEAVDRHVVGARSGRVAIRWLGKGGERVDLRHGELAEHTARFAGALASMGVRPGDRVCALLGRMLETTLETTDKAGKEAP